MPNTNFQTIYQMPGIVNDIVKQATGRESVSQIDMDFVTVGQDKQTVQHEIDYTAVASFVNNNQLPLTVLAKITAVQNLHGYDNPWPAGGGKNLLNPETATGQDITWSEVTLSSDLDSEIISISGTADQNGGRTSLVLKQIHLPAGTYYIYAENITGTRPQIVVQMVSGNTVTVIAVAPNRSFTLEQDSDIAVGFNVVSGTTYDVAIKLQIESGSEFTEWVPYSNICPITGFDQCVITHYGEDETDADTYTITFPGAAGTVYGGSLNLTTGLLTVTHGYISSYVDESLPGEWISDRDVYAAGTTPTVGAEVVYVLAEPVTYELDPVEVKSMIGQNNVFADTGDVAVSYTSYIPVI